MDRRKQTEFILNPSVLSSMLDVPKIKSYLTIKRDAGIEDILTIMSVSYMHIPKKACHYAGLQHDNYLHVQRCKNMVRNKIELMNSSSRSPDLNPLENVFN